MKKSGPRQLPARPPVNLVISRAEHAASDVLAALEVIRARRQAAVTKPKRPADVAAEAGAASVNGGAAATPAPPSPHVPAVMPHDAVLSPSAALHITHVSTPSPSRLATSRLGASGLGASGLGQAPGGGLAASRFATSALFQTSPDSASKTAATEAVSDTDIVAALLEEGGGGGSELAQQLQQAQEAGEEEGEAEAEAEAEAEEEEGEILPHSASKASNSVNSSPVALARQQWRREARVLFASPPPPPPSRVGNTGTGTNSDSDSRSSSSPVMDPLALLSGSTGRAPAARVSPLVPAVSRALAAVADAVTAASTATATATSSPGTRAALAVPYPPAPAASPLPDARALLGLLTGATTPAAAAAVASPSASSASSATAAAPATLSSSPLPPLPLSATGSPASTAASPVRVHERAHVHEHVQARPQPPPPQWQSYPLSGTPTGAFASATAVAAPVRTGPSLAAVVSLQQRAKLLQHAQRRMRSEVAALLHQSQRHLDALAATAHEQLNAAIVVGAEQRREWLRRVAATESEAAELRLAVSERDEAIVALARQEEVLQSRLAMMEAALAKQAHVTNAMRDTLAEATGCIRVLVRVRPLLPGDCRVDSRVGVTVRWLLAEFCKRVRAAAVAQVGGSSSSGSSSGGGGTTGAQAVVARISLRQLVRLLGWAGEPEALFQLLQFNPRAPEAMAAHVPDTPGILSHSGASTPSATATGGSGVKLLGIDVGPALLPMGHSPDHMRQRLLACPELLDNELFEGAGTSGASGGDPFSSFVERVVSAVSRDGGASCHQFDRVLGPTASQAAVFPDVQPLLDAALRGKNATVLAYGATGSGKSYTLLGSLSDSTSTSSSSGSSGSSSSGSAATADEEEEEGAAATVPASAGILMRSIAYLLQALQAEARAAAAAASSSSSSHSHHHHHHHRGGGSGSRGAAAAAAAAPRPRKLVLSCFELYGDACRDLLQQSLDSGVASKLPPSSAAAVGALGSVHISGVGARVACVDIISLPQAAALLTAALVQARAQAATVLNDASSRSHAVVRIAIQGPPPASARLGTVGTALTARHHPQQQHSASSSPAAVESVLQFCDLAGSERVRDSRAQGIALAEACAVNGSLSALSDVVTAIARGAAHVPYRNSKLTRVLEPTLTGASRALVLVTVSCVPLHREQTSASLRFGAMLAGTTSSRPDADAVRDAVEALLTLGPAAIS